MTMMIKKVDIIQAHELMTILDLRGGYVLICDDTYISSSKVSLRNLNTNKEISITTSDAIAGKVVEDGFILITEEKSEKGEGFSLKIEKYNKNGNLLVKKEQDIENYYVRPVKANNEIYITTAGVTYRLNEGKLELEYLDTPFLPSRYKNFVGTSQSLYIENNDVYNYNIEKKEWGNKRKIPGYRDATNLYIWEDENDEEEVHLLYEKDGNVWEEKRYKEEVNKNLLVKINYTVHSIAYDPEEMRLVVLADD